MDAVADLLRQVSPAVPVILRQAVLNGGNGKLACPVDPVIGHLRGAELALVGLLEDVLALLRVVELTRRGIEREDDVLPGVEAEL